MSSSIALCMIARLTLRKYRTLHNPSGYVTIFSADGKVLRHFGWVVRGDINIP